MALSNGTLFKLRSSTSLDPYDSIVVTAPSGGYTAGDMVKIEDVVGVVVEDALIDVEVAVVVLAAKIVVPCNTVATAANWTVGTKVYYDSTAANVTATGSGMDLCGTVTTAGAVGDTDIEIFLDGRLALYT